MPTWTQKNHLLPCIPRTATHPTFSLRTRRFVKLDLFTNKLGRRRRQKSALSSVEALSELAALAAKISYSNRGDQHRLVRVVITISSLMCRLQPLGALGDTVWSRCESLRAYSWWEVGKVESEPELFFLMSTSTQLSAYANHEFKIISIPTQLSAYANHEFKNWYYLAKVARRQTAWAKYWSRAYAQLEQNITYIMNLLCSKTSEDSSTYA